MRHDASRSSTHASLGTVKGRVFIVDDHPIVRQGLALLINRELDLAVCGDAEEAASALDRIQELKPDLIIVDISLNGPDGLALLKAFIRIEDSSLRRSIVRLVEGITQAGRH